MQNFMKTILNGVQNWTKGKIKDSTADWNQNDSSKDSYVKNRTHWEETKETVLVDNLTFDEYNNGNAPQCNFIPNQVYTVIWNGKKYENLVCYFNEEHNIIADYSNLGQPCYIDDDGGDGLYIEPKDDNTDWTVSISTTQAVVHKLDPKYLDLPENLATTDEVQSALDVANEAYQIADNVSGDLHTVETNLAAETTAREEADAAKMNAINPVGTGSFSMGRKEGTDVGAYSHAEGLDTTASGMYSHAEGLGTTASGMYSHAEGMESAASDAYCHAEGYRAAANGYASHAEGTHSYAEGNYSHAEGDSSHAEGQSSHAEGYYSHALGRSQHAQGEYNISDPDANPDDPSQRGRYAHIVGNGVSGTNRSNAHTLDWDGNAWFAGDVYVGSASRKDRDEGSKKLATEEQVNSKTQVQIVYWEEGDE